MKCVSMTTIKIRYTNRAIKIAHTDRSSRMYTNFDRKKSDYLCYVSVCVWTGVTAQNYKMEIRR